MKMKRLLSIVLSLTLLFSLLSQGAVAFADDMFEPVSVEAEDKDASEDYDDIYVYLTDEEKRNIALSILSSGKGSASAIVDGNVDIFSNADVWGIFANAADEKSSSQAMINGNVSVNSNNGAAYGIIADGLGNSGVVVDGDVTSYSWDQIANGIDIRNGTVSVTGSVNANSEYGTAFGALASMLAEGQGEASLKIDESVSAGAWDGNVFGIGSKVAEGNSANISIGEDVSVNIGVGSVERDSSFLIPITDLGMGISSDAQSSGNSDITVGGNVEVSAISPFGIYSHSDTKGSSNVAVEGDIITKGSGEIIDNNNGISVRGNGSGVSSSAGEKSESNVSVGGDVIVSDAGRGDGISSSSSREGKSTVDVVGAVNVNVGEAVVTSEMGLPMRIAGVGTGVSSYDSEKGKSYVSVGEDVTVIAGQATGLSLDSSSEGSSAIDVHGDVNVTSLSPLITEYVSMGSAGDFPMKISNPGKGISSTVQNGGTGSVTIGGSVSVTAVDTATGVEVSVSNSGERQTSSTVDIAKEIEAYSSNGSATGVSLINEDGTIEFNAGDAINAYAETGSATGLNTQSNGSNTKVTVEGDIISNAPIGDSTALSATAGNKGNSEITVSGNVTASSDSGWADGVTAGAGGNSKISVSIAGNVEKLSPDGGFAVNANSFGKDSKVTMAIDGNVISAGADNGYNGGAVQIMAMGNGQVDVSVGKDVVSDSYYGVGIRADGNQSAVNFSAAGDVTSEGIGMVMSANTRTDIDVLVEGTISGAERAVAVYGVDADDVKLTVWKLDLAEGENAIQYWGSGTSEEIEKNAAAIEDNILYIIKVEEPEEGATVSLQGTTESHGLDTAREGEKVSLKTSLEKGFKLVGAYNGEDAETKAALLQDDNGDYYIIVPKGGGVYLTIDAERIFNINNFGSPILPGASSENQNGQASMTYLPGSASDGPVMLSSSPSMENGMAQVTLYKNGSYVIYKTDGSAESGAYTLGNGTLSFDGRLVQYWIDAEGNIHCIYINGAGERIEFVIDRATASSLAA